MKSRFLFLLVVLFCGDAARGATRPNVLVVLIDDLGYSDLGCYGGEIPTPNIDRLAATGLRFTRMGNSARCCPTRASLLTGLHPAQAGVPNFGGDLSQESATLAEVLKQSGYATYAVGKWHLGNTLPTRRGFDDYFGFPKGHSQNQWKPGKYVRLPKGREPEIETDGRFYATDVFTEYALEFIRQGEKSRKPWFLYLAHSSPHFPIQAPMASARPFLDTYRRGWDELREERFGRLKRIGLADSDAWKLSPRSLVPVEGNNAIANGYSGKPNPAWDSLGADRREDLARRMALYAAMVKHVDDGIGRIVSELQSSGSLDHTLILLLSDNGACYEWGPFGFDGKSRAGRNTLHKGDALETMGGPTEPEMSYGSAWANLCNTPFRLYKHFTHEGGILTPFIVHWPEGVNESNRWVRDPAHVMDLMPTIIEATGATYPKARAGHPVPPMEGVSLGKLFGSSGAKLAERAICFQHAGAYAIRKGSWKLVRGKRFPGEVKWELYNIDKDPCELNDLAAQDPERVASLAREWLDWAERTGSLTKPEIERLREL